MKQLCVFILMSIVPYNFAQTTQQIGGTTVTIDTLISTMTVPWEIRLENNEYMWVTERPGTVSRVNLQTGVKTVVLDLSGVAVVQGESGLLGLALHPDFETTPDVFLVYTYGPIDGDGYYFEKLEKYTFNGTQLVNPVALIENIPAWMNHAGSRLFFLSDQTLLMSTGERYQTQLAQDSTSLAGKYLRVNMDGTIPADNPDPTSLIYTMGHRNSQGICRIPSGKIVISEHGPSTDDELQILEAGKNYGWPLIHGFCDESFETAPCATGLYQEPIYNWTPTIATSDLVFYENPYFPEWNNRLLMTSLNGQRIVTIQLNVTENGVADEDQYFQGEFGRLRDIAIGPNKEIYIATNTGLPNAQPIIRITPPYFASVDEANQIPFTISPNPASDYITIDVPLDDATVRILDLNGREVLTINHVETSAKISLLKLFSGFYMVEVSQSGGYPRQQRLHKL